MNERLAATNVKQTSDSPEPLQAPDELLQAQALANLLDTAVRVPFIGVKVGLDFLIGIIPFIGDTLVMLAALRIVHLAHKLGVPKALKIRMLGNVAADYLLGLMPILGDIIDIFFKANLRNVRIIEQWWVSENKDRIDAMRAQMVAAWERQNKKPSNE